MVSPTAKQNREHAERSQRKHTAKNQRDDAGRLASENEERGRTVQMLVSGSSNECRLGTSILARDGDHQIGEQIAPQSRPRNEACLVASAVAKQLHSFFAMCFAKT